MDDQLTAEQVLSAVGGKNNIVEDAICMTRLRLKVHDPKKINSEALNGISSVLGCATKGTQGIEVVFGPNMIERIYPYFSALVRASMPQNTEAEKQPKRVETPEHKRSYRMQVRANSKRSKKIMQSNMDSEDIKLLEDMFPQAQATTPTPKRVVAHIRTPKVSQSGKRPQQSAEQADNHGKKLLIINGPNINFLGIREPTTYGHDTYQDLLNLCHVAAKEVGFTECFCFQSNHEGDIVDQIQDAYHVFDGLIINPAAYTHTSVAILDAVKAVSIPTIEVHISDVSAREDFRQISYIRKAAFETISGEGIEGYRHAIADMWEHLRKI